MWFFLLSFYLSFFLAYSQRSHIGCLPYFHTWCRLRANLGCRSETWCTRLAEIQDAKKIAKNSPSAHHRTILSGYIFATEAYIDIRQSDKNLLTAISPHMSSQYGERRPTSGGLLVWGTLANFNGFCVLASLLQRHRSTEANQTLHDVWPLPGLVHITTFKHCRRLVPE